MSISMTIFTFINVWCIMLFIVMPFRVEEEQNPSATQYAAAPKLQPWKKKLLINTAVSVLITAMLALIISSGIIQVRDL